MRQQKFPMKNLRVLCVCITDGCVLRTTLAYARSSFVARCCRLQPFFLPVTNFALSERGFWFLLLCE